MPGNCDSATLTTAAEIKRRSRAFAKEKNRATATFLRVVMIIVAALSVSKILSDMIQLLEQNSVDSFRVEVTLCSGGNAYNERFLPCGLKLQTTGRFKCFKVFLTDS